MIQQIYKKQKQLRNLDRQQMVPLQSNDMDLSLLEETERDWKRKQLAYVSGKLQKLIGQALTTLDELLS